MNKGQKNFLDGCLGAGSCELLSKAIHREGFTVNFDQVEQYLAMLAVPHTILAWVNSVCRQLADGGNKEFDIPGHASKLLLNKIANDIYSGQIVEDGKVLHRFSNLTIPQLAGNIMTALEMYEDLDAKVSGHKAVMDAIAPLIEKLVAAHQAPAPVQITINTAPAAQPAPVVVPSLVQTPPVMKEEPKDEVKKVSIPASIAEEVSEGENEVRRNPTGQKGSSLGSVASSGPGTMSPKMWEPGQRPTDDRRRAHLEHVARQKAAKKEETSESSSSPISKSCPTQHTYMQDDAKLSETARKIVQRAISTKMTKAEMALHCPDCGGKEFDGDKFVGCVCLGDLATEGNLKVQKSEDGNYRIVFGRGWDRDNIEMLLEILKRKQNV